MSLLSEVRVAVRKVRRIVGLREPAPVLDANYYQTLHEQESYQANNWLVADLPFLKQQTSGVLVEIGCGNGRFVDAAAEHFARIEACDWAKSPLLREILTRHSNVAFHACDVTKDELALRGDLVASADVLEHFPLESLQQTLAKIDAVAPLAYHKIACYHDGHSHLSVMPAEEWLQRFRQLDPAYRLLRVEHRRGNPQHAVAVIGKNLREA